MYIDPVTRREIDSSTDSEFGADVVWPEGIAERSKLVREVRAATEQIAAGEGVSNAVAKARLRTFFTPTRSV